MLQCKMCCKAGDSLDFGTRVWLRVPGVPISFIFLAVTKVYSSSQFTDDVEVNAAADFSFERRDIDERLGSEIAGSKVSICSHFLTESEDSLLWSDFACTPFRTANGTQ